jgi:hypothetical protein
MCCLETIPSLIGFKEYIKPQLHPMKSSTMLKAKFKIQKEIWFKIQK